MIHGENAGFFSFWLAAREWIWIWREGDEGLRTSRPIVHGDPQVCGSPQTSSDMKIATKWWWRWRIEWTPAFVGKNIHTRLRLPCQKRFYTTHIPRELCHPICFITTTMNLASRLSAFFDPFLHSFSMLCTQWTFCPLCMLCSTIANLIILPFHLLPNAPELFALIA